MEASQASQASQVSGSNAVGPSASATVDNEAVPGHSFLVTLCCPQPATIARKRKNSYQPASTWEAKGQLRVAPSIPNLLPLHNV